MRIYRGSKTCNDLGLNASVLLVKFGSILVYKCIYKHLAVSSHFSLGVTPGLLQTQLNEFKVNVF